MLRSLRIARRAVYEQKNRKREKTEPRRNPMPLHEPKTSA
jgi:hypothetical protein